MTRLSFILLFALVALLASYVSAAESVRVVSQTQGNDELLLAVAAPEQIAALSHLSRSTEFSAVSAEAAAYPQLSQNTTAESILAYHPTLVLFTNYSRIELIEQVRRAGIRTLIIENHNTLDDAYASLRAIAREIDPEAEARAEHVIVDTTARVEALRTLLKDTKPIRVIAPSTYGVIPGDQTTFQDLCDHAGAENLAATLGHLHGHAAPPSEQMIAWPVDKLILTTSEYPENGSRPAASASTIASALAPFLKLPPYQFMPAVRERRVALLAPYQIGCVSHRRIDAYEQLARQLHPALFAENIQRPSPDAQPQTPNSEP